jgi:serine/threonine protein phosphatase 1
MLCRHASEFLNGLELSFELGDYFFTHAGVRPGLPLTRQSPDDLMWIREQFLASNTDFGKVVVHGHTPSPEPQRHHNRIGIDTGAYATGRLTCVVLEGIECRFLHPGLPLRGAP